jgi:hypothetical protein
VGGRPLALLLAGALGVLLLAGWQLYRRRAGAGAERLDVDELGLALMEGCCAFVVFTSPACRPCKTAIRVVENAAARSPGVTEVRTIDAMARPEVALRYDVRTIPTVFLITASGHVVDRWRSVPHPPEVEAALATV